MGGSSPLGIVTEHCHVLWTFIDLVLRTTKDDNFTKDHLESLRRMFERLQGQDTRFETTRKRALKAFELSMSLTYNYRWEKKSILPSGLVDFTPEKLPAEIEVLRTLRDDMVVVDVENKLAQDSSRGARQIGAVRRNNVRKATTMIIDSYEKVGVGQDYRIVGEMLYAVTELITGLNYQLKAAEVLIHV